jgi:hypothetical protein
MAFVFIRRPDCFACLDRDKARALDQRATLVRGGDAQPNAQAVGRVVEILWYAIV